MTYEQLMNKHDELITLAITTDDTNLAIFYKNAAEGFKRRARALSNAAPSASSQAKEAN